MSGIFLLKRHGFYANILIVNTLTRKWLEYAKADLEAAVVLVKSGKTHYSYQAAVMHCHQAEEKMLKTLIVSNNEAPKRIHDLIKLTQDTGVRIPLGLEQYVKENKGVV